MLLSKRAHACVNRCKQACYTFLVKYRAQTPVSSIQHGASS